MLMIILSLAATAATSQDAGLGKVRWLAGCWELQRGTRSTVEIWSRPNGGMMVGASSTTANGVVREFEHLRLTAEGDSVVYTALPSGQPSAAFRGTASDSGFVVENLQHDFPQRISYQRRGADSLIARIEGPGAGGTRAISFGFRKAACGG